MARSPESSPPNLPADYWADIRTYCGTILDPLPVTVSFIPGLKWLMHLQIQEAQWPAFEENHTALLEKRWLSICGRVRPPDQWLEIVDDAASTPEVTTKKRITFNPSPYKEKIVHISWRCDVSNLSAKTTGDLGAGILKVQQALQANEESFRLAESSGLTVPGLDDYELLHEELRRGALYSGSDQAE